MITFLTVGRHPRQLRPAATAGSLGLPNDLWSRAWPTGHGKQYVVIVLSPRARDLRVPGAHWAPGPFTRCGSAVPRPRSRLRCSVRGFRSRTGSRILRSVIESCRARHLDLSDGASCKLVMMQHGVREQIGDIRL